MFKLVIGSSRVLEIGKRYISILDEKGVLHPGQPYVVIAVSNLDEWVNCLRALGVEPFEEQIAIPCEYYYEIQTD